MLLSCGDGLVASPFVDSPAGAPASDAGAAPPPADAGRARTAPSFDVVEGEVLGEPCVDDAQCDDGIDCTFDACDSDLGLCRFVGDDTLCADGAFCNGDEVCHPRLGCRPGPPASCSDSTPCTVDRCDELTRACVREPRDVDGDGDVDVNCQPGSDCDDLDPEVSSLVAERCGNQRDDDCDGEVDEADCQELRFDSCDDPLVVTASGSYQVGGPGAHLELGASCAASQLPLVDFVIQVAVADGPARDVELVARAPSGVLWLARRQACDAEAPELDCLPGRFAVGVESAARLVLRDVPPGLHSVVLVSSASAAMALEVQFRAPESLATNLGCDAALALTPSEPVVADLAVVAPSLPSACETGRADRLYVLDVEEPSDLLLLSRSLDGLGDPRVSLRAAACEADSAELGCRIGASVELRRRALDAGRYFVAVSATGPSVVELVAELSPPGPAPASETCQGAPSLDEGIDTAVRFDDHLDDVEAGCQVGSVDAARSFRLGERSDVLALGRFSPGDSGAVSLSRAPCAVESTLACAVGGSRPVRAVRHDLAPGDYRVVMESQGGLPAALTLARRAAVAPSFVPGADSCDEVVTIPASGGFYRGNTSNATSLHSASCDFATPVGAPEQLLRLELAERRRVIFDMRGSDFDTLLNVRQGPACPGRELARACVVSQGADRSFLDLDLAPGVYYLQIDGYAGSSGAWFLDVFSWPL